MRRYRRFGTTADVGVVSRGEDLREAFEAQAAGMFSIMVDIRGVRSEKAFSVEIDTGGGDEVELLAAWLEELLYISDVNRVYLKSFAITSLGGGRLGADVLGEGIDPSRHILKTPVKAVTYHGMKVERTPSGVTTTVVYDI